MKIRVFEAFAGYGSQSLALERLKRHFPEFDYKVVGISEIDKYAVTAYNALHGDVPNYGDISMIDWNEVPDFDLFTYSFPCTNLSNAGKQEGCEEGSGTASSLLWECRKAIAAKRPRYLLMENVKALVSLKFLPYLLKWQSELVSYGYSNFARVLNSKCYGIPQNRERVFMVSILDRQATYHFPEPFPLDRRIKDILEEDVDERYFLSEKFTKTVLSDGKNGFPGGTGVRMENDDTAPTINATCYKIQRNNCFIKMNESRHKMTDLEPRTDGVSNTITTVQKDNLLCVPVAVIGSAQKNAYKGSVKEPAQTITAACGMGGGQTPMVLMVAENLQRMAEKSRGEEIVVTIDADGNLRPRRMDKAKFAVLEYLTEKDTSVASTLISVRPNNVYGESTDYRIRKLTPRECLRLMDVDDSDIDKLMAAGISSTQLYKMAGNSIVVNVLYHIFRKMFVNKENENIQLTLF